MFVLCPVQIRDEKILLLFGKNLKEIRNQKGISQEELAHRSGLALSQIARLEIGSLNTTICTVYAIAKGLKITPGELLPPADYSLN